MDADSNRRGARFVDPKVLARISSLELLARTVVDGFINGLHKAPYLGVSIDFAEHRGYMPGDDIRFIDWRVFARTDRFYVKQFEADTNANFSVMLDVSRSMSFGSKGLTKLDYGRYLAACLTYFCTKQRDRVGLITFDSDIVTRVPPSANILTWCCTSSIESRLETRVRWNARSFAATEFFRRRGIIVVISDFYEDPTKAVGMLKPLSYGGNDLIVFQILDPAEIDFPYDEPTNFQDLETGQSMPVVPEKLREQYRQLVQEHIAALSKLCGESRIDYALFNTATPIDHALFKFLAMREKLSRVR